MAERANGKHQVWKAKGRAMDTNTGESPGHQSQSQKLGNSPSEEEMGHWTPTGVESKDYDDDDDDDQDLKGNTPVHRQPAQFRTNELRYMPKLRHPSNQSSSSIQN